MLEDSILIGKLKAGDTNAFNKLVSAHKIKVVNTCYKFLLNKEDAEDIAQEVFIEVFKSIRAFRGDSRLSSWIYRIAITKSLDEIKKRNRKKRLTSIGKMIHLDDLVDWLTGGASAEKQLDEKEGIKKISIALNSLPDNQRIAFTLSKIEGYSNTEIADIMETTNAAIDSLIYRARKKLADELTLNTK